MPLLRRSLPLVAALVATAAVTLPARAAVFDHGTGTYGWMLPPAGYSDEDYPRGVRFPVNPASGFAGMMYVVLGANPAGTGDGRVWDTTTSPRRIANAVPVFCIEDGVEVLFSEYYTSPGKTTTVTVGGFTPNADVTGSGTDLTATPTKADAAGDVEMLVTLADTVAVGQKRTLTVSQTGGSTTRTASITAADPYKVQDWDAARAAAKANLPIAAWIASHADDYTTAGVKGTTMNNESDPVSSAVMSGITQGGDRAGVEGAAAQLAIWQVLAGKNVVAGVPEASSPIANYQAANPHSVASQLRTAGGAFQNSPLQSSLDTAVVSRAIELFVAATGDGTIGGSDDKSESEPWHTPTLSLAIDANTSVVTVTGVRTSASGASEPLPGVTVTLTGADFDPATAGVQNGTVTLGTNGTGTSPITLTGSTQSITATAKVTIPAGSLLSTAARGATPSALQLQQLITAKAADVTVTASGTAAATTTTTTTTTTPGTTTTTPGTTTTVTATTAPGTSSPTSTTTVAGPPTELPFTGPHTALAVILLSSLLGAFAVFLRRRSLT